MGELYRALDSRLGRIVAVKVLPASLASDPDRLRRFEQEARATGALDHPSVLVVHDFGTHGGAPYLVTELLEGETLRERIGRGAIPTAQGGRDRGTRGAGPRRGPRPAHRPPRPQAGQRVPHPRRPGEDPRLRPREGEGAARRRHRGRDAAAGDPGRGDLAGVLLGTAGYMSPEQVRGNEADGRSDIFALGAILYEMLTARRAFARGSTRRDAQRDPARGPAGAGRLSGAVPRALDSVLRRCLEKDPDDRFQTARDLGFALDALAQGADSDARQLAFGPGPRCAGGVRRPLAARAGRGPLAPSCCCCSGPRPAPACSPSLARNARRVSSATAGCCRARSVRPPAG